MIFLKKVSQCRKKTERGDILEFFNIHSVGKKPKKLKGDPLGKKITEESRNAEKTEYLWSRPVLYVTRETFLVQFLRPTGTIWRLRKIL